MVFPELKKSKAEGGLFWDSGLWSPASYGGTPENVKFTVNYVKQRKSMVQLEIKQSNIG